MGVDGGRELVRKGIRKGGERIKLGKNGGSKYWERQLELVWGVSGTMETPRKSMRVTLAKTPSNGK